MKIIRRDWAIKLTQEEKKAIQTTAEILTAIDNLIYDNEWDDICGDYNCSLDEIVHDLNITITIAEQHEQKNLYSEVED